MAENHPTRSRGLALAVLCAASLMVVLDSSIVAVALPAIQADLGFTSAGLSWVFTAYLVAFGGLLLLSGRLGDLLGRRRVFLGGLGLFTVASLIAGLATDAGVLVAARFAQGVGGALASAVVLGMIVMMYPEPRARAKAIGVYSFTQAAGASIGLIAGGALTQALSWHWTFSVNLPIGVAALLLAVRVVEADRGTGLRDGLDVLGAVLVTAAVMLGVYGISASSWGALVAAVGLLAAFAVWQAKARTPLLPLRLFKIRAVAGANVVMVLMVAGMLGFQFVTALYLQQVLGLDALETGVAFLPVPLVIAVASLGFADKLAARFGPRAVLLTGLGLVIAGLLLLTRVGVDGAYFVDVLPPLLLMGLGAGAAIPALMGLAMADVPAADTGVASGLINTTQQAGAAVGTAVLAAVAASRTKSLSALDHREALAAGFRLAYGVSAGFLIAAVALGGVVLARRPPAVSTLQSRELTF
ncbi:major facilitator transporter [Amycolatopsis mediterranei S699]|uniref:Major facilitator transporter n=3 Tax=Amycolatopsis mediterranei TaxID=33910 RepID=A0A0H3DB05_AMYMU|nr:DHA2 family efflux MFS transporter permease subunit [Amycolatopsis mediterranei]ADJ47816.1 major facilitator transporter [Amycolatopsis mediterranei U32]AEK44705.1 major facilitator transporter [Amycolatopsis mediterranei S699]AFO79527.1 major facilitator transporter [Amycolatopsis mediterranei S699]AGT86655.1 major facilitator transporter [Amycolatopsis mediterranei RB]KDO10379.1 DSBA oxidoreductase [Amycolatopsis mediterranei]